MTSALGSVRITGLTSAHDLTLDVATPITVLIGPNGSGKSNVIGGLELVGRIADGQLQEYVVRCGGFGNLLHRSSRPGLSAGQVGIEVWGDSEEAGVLIGYRTLVQHAPQDEAVLSETLLRRDRTAPSAAGEGAQADLGVSRESRLTSVAQASDAFNSVVAREVLPILTGCRVFHFQDTSPDAPVKQRASDADNLTLAPDARNIAPLLARLQIEDGTRFRRIVRAVQTVAPFVGDFVLRPEGGRLRLRWQENGLDNVFSADELSDGTLRFICLATLLLQPERPGTVVLDEPELGLHPFAINQLAALIRSASTEGGKVVLATQSVTLLSHFDASEVAIVERGTNGTTVRRLDVDELDDWLAEYSLGELWEKNVLGGRPRPDSTALPVQSAER